MAKKSLGQNFLKSKQALRSIIAAGQINRDDLIFEIGPGRGALTSELLGAGGNVIAIEKDFELMRPLQEKFSKEISEGRLELIQGDILSFDETTLQSRKKSYKVIANIPYYITGFVIRKFLESAFQPSLMVLMVQKEVAERIVARDGKESLLSLSVKAYGLPRYVEKVQAKYFSPVPNVDSAIIAIENISKDFFSDISEKGFFNTLHLGFAHKRKFVTGNIGQEYEHKKEPVAHILKTSGLGEKARPEEVSLSVWKEITKALNA